MTLTHDGEDQNRDQEQCGHAQVQAVAEEARHRLEGWRVCSGTRAAHHRRALNAAVGWRHLWLSMCLPTCFHPSPLRHPQTWHRRTPPRPQARGRTPYAHRTVYTAYTIFPYIRARTPVDPTGRFAAVESCCTTAMACMRTLSYGMHVKSTEISVLCSQLPTALYDPLGCFYRPLTWISMVRVPGYL